MQLPLLCQKSGDICHDICASRSYRKQSDRPAIRPNTGRFETSLNSLLIITLLGCSQHLTKKHCYCSVTNAFWLVF